MSSNYKLLKESKNELIDELLSYFQHIINVSKETYFYTEKHNKVEDDFLDKINLLEEKSDILYDNVLNSSVWIIQSNQPRASNLRFIISCINSAKELERASDYLLLITKFLNKRTLDEKLHNYFMQAFKRCIDILEISYDEFLNNDPFQARQTIKLELENYKSFLSTNTKIMIKHFDELNPNSDILDALIELINAINDLERIVTHVYNLIKSFNYIDLQ
ncbi:MAG: hypothetical protein K2K73_03005 [Ureaplasma sp.]|nr:hypothetical protein [Ureaplasma sp.]